MKTEETMNILEKLCALLTAEGRQIKYGVRTEETANCLITIRTGESGTPAAHLRDAADVSYPVVILSVYDGDFMSAYRLLETLKAEIKAAVKDSVHILHRRDRETKYDAAAGRYELSAEFKIIQI